MKKTFTCLLIMISLAIQAQTNPDPYVKGNTGRMTLWVSSAAPYYGIYAYDYDNNQEMGQYDGSWKTYPTIEIGEYEVTSKNLLLHYRDKWSLTMGWMNFSQAIIDQMNQEYQQRNNVDLATFLDINGSYASLYGEGLSYRDDFKVFDPTNRTRQLTGWDLMSSTELMQMFGQSPVTSDNPMDNIMNFLGASQADVPASYTADWFQYNNTSGFTMTPLGRRHSGQVGENGQKWFGYKAESGIRLKDYPYGMLLFSRYEGISIRPNLYHLCQARYSRAKTDQELGYKLYVDNCTDQVIMLPYNQQSAFVELPKGLERGIALRYANRNQMKITKKWSEIVAEASNIRAAIPSLPQMPALNFPECPEVLPPVTDTRDLVFVYNGTEYPYKAVRIGEYYWMDKNFNVPVNNIPITKAQIDYHHQIYGMFNWNSRSENKTYWQYLGARMGISNPTDQQVNNILLPEFEKYYGTYYSADRDANAGADPKNPVSILRRLGSMKEKVDGRYYGTDTINHWPGDIRSQVKYKFWDMPTAADALQLLAMCGHATTPEVRQYLSYAEGAVPVAFSTVAGFDWFYANPYHFGPGGSYGADAFNTANSNKYKLNMTPNGFRWGVTQVNARVKTETGFTTITIQPREFVGAGMNQAYVLPLIDKKFDKENINMESRILTSLQVGDHPQIMYDKWASTALLNVRWCRALTDQELGYKLYINQNMDEVADGTAPVQIYTDKIGFQDGSRNRSGEEVLLEKVRNGLIQPGQISIIKLGLYDAVPNGYHELPRGYIRGFYVQYILNNPTPSKTVAGIISEAIRNPFLWIKKDTSTRSTMAEDNVTHLVVEDANTIKVHPNPVSSVLYLSGNQIKKTEIYTTSGALVVSETGNVNNINVNSLTKGIYILKVETTDGKTEILKITKE